jgi:all-trans-retinol dehydrogenase (NAD+)
VRVCYNIQHVFVAAEVIGAGIFTMDTLVAFLKKTVLNPILTVPIFLALQYTPVGRNMLGNDALFQKLKILVVLGVIGRVNRYLSWGVQNNWRGDAFCPSEEIVVVTGGSSGIGAAIVKELTSPGNGIKAVVVLDVQPLMFTAGLEPLHGHCSNTK